MLLVIGRGEDKEIGKNKHKEPTVICKCDCGNIVEIVKSRLISGKTKSCGCKKNTHEDLSGKKFGKLLVIKEHEERDKNNNILWECVCDCGEKKIISGANLKSGKSKSCGCGISESTKDRLSLDLSNKKFGRLTVICKHDDIIDKKGRYFTSWKCKCDCGNECVVPTRSLQSGNTRSCGCLKSEESSKRFSLDLEGKKFGKLTVLYRDGTFIGENGTRYSLWKCKCECGTVKSIIGHSLVSGKTYSCGCVASKSEEEIRNILNNLNVDYKTQYTFPDLVSPNGGKLRFDFAIIKNNRLLFLLEYQGIQHFKERTNHKDFGKLQREVTDKMKDDYCKLNNITLYKITYLENIESKINDIISLYI